MINGAIQHTFYNIVCFHIKVKSKIWVILKNTLENSDQPFSGRGQCKLAVYHAAGAYHPVGDLLNV